MVRIFVPQRRLTLLIEPEFTRGKRAGLLEGQTRMKNKMLDMFTQWAVTYPDSNSPVVDELWSFVDKMREVKVDE